MAKDIKKHEIHPEERQSIWGKWIRNLRDWHWYTQEHPDWFDVDIQGAVKRWIIRPLRNLSAHLKELIHDRKAHKQPETESKIGMLLLFAWGSLPRLGSNIRERLEGRRKNAIRTEGNRRSFFEQLQVHPAAFLGGALSIAVVAVLLSLYTLGTSTKYDGVELATVSSSEAVALAVSQVEEVTRETLNDAEFTLDADKLETKTSVVLRTDIEDSETLEAQLNDQLDLVEYGYALYVDDELIAATTFPGALEGLLEQLQLGYRTENTVECGFVEDVQVREGFVDKTYMMNLGHIAEILNDTKEGAVTYKVKAGDTLYDIANEYDTSVSALRKMNPGYSARGLHIGDVLTISNAVPYLTVKNVERQNYVQNVPYSIKYKDNSSMYQGDYTVLSKGVYGKADITANVTFVNGTETERQIVASVILQDPVTEVQARGTKPRPSWFPTGSFRWPTSGVITSYFGYREAPNAAAQTYHNAIDIANSSGTPIYAADGGTVTYAGWSGGYGLLIKIEHNNTPYVTYYAHCSSLYVSVGDHVYKGEHIAAMGSTGNSTGPHLHFGVLKNDTWVNPLNYLP